MPAAGRPPADHGAPRGGRAGRRDGRRDRHRRGSRDRRAVAEGDDGQAVASTVARSSAAASADRMAGLSCVYSEAMSEPAAYGPSRLEACPESADFVLTTEVSVECRWPASAIVPAATSAARPSRPIEWQTRLRSTPTVGPQTTKKRATAPTIGRRRSGEAAGRRSTPTNAVRARSDATPPGHLRLPPTNAPIRCPCRFHRPLDDRESGLGPPFAWSAGGAATDSAGDIDPR